MARIIGESGATSRMLAEKAGLERQTIYLIAAGSILVLLVILLWLMSHIGRLGKGGYILLGIAAVIIIGFFKAIELEADSIAKRKKEQRNATRGAKGEETVASILACLPDDYYVFHDLTKLAGDIDHIVVGPTGLFVIETKAHGGQVAAQGSTVMVNGHPPEKDFIAQSWRNTFWVRDVLKNVGHIEERIHPILVFPHAFIVSRGKVKGVRVINSRFLLDAILKEPAIDMPVEQIVEILKRKMGMA